MLEGKSVTEKAFLIMTNVNGSNALHFFLNDIFANISKVVSNTSMPAKNIDQI